MMARFDSAASPRCVLLAARARVVAGMPHTSTPFAPRPTTRMPQAQPGRLNATPLQPTRAKGLP
jgi:hypothetical protein